MSNPLPPWTTRNSFQRDPHQRIIDRLNGLHNITPPAGGEVLRTPFGTGVQSTPRLLPGTDYTVYIDNLISGTDKGGKYTGYCWRAYPDGGYEFPPTYGPPHSIACEIWHDDELYSSNSPAVPQQHWAKVQSHGIGRFTGEYNSDTPPKPILHAGGFGANAVTPTFAGFSTAGQQWQRDHAFADLSNPANLVSGDQAITVPICTSQDAVTKVCRFGSITFDASGRATVIVFA